MVVQCPTCQSKFRIADDKVTDRGVRVRCTSCKNVFQVKKPGGSGAEAPGPGNTVEMSSLGAAAVAARGAGARPAASKPPPAAARPAAAARPSTAARSSPNGTARRLEANDLFGMAELTGDAPLGDLAKGLDKVPPPPPPASKPAPAKAKSMPMPNFDDIDIEVNDEPSGPPPPKPAAPPKRPPPPPASVVVDDEVTAADAPAPKPPPPPPDSENGEDPAGVLGTFKSPLKDPFEGMNLGEPGTGAVELSTQPKKDKLAEAAHAEAHAAAAAPAEPPPPEVPPAKAMVSSALTGLVGAALAIAVVLVTALSGDSSVGWLGFGPRDEVVATRVVSGLYDTAGGKPVFYIRGRVENRGKKLRGPVKVTAELISDGATEAHADAIAGAEPTPEEVWSIRSTTDVEKLNRTLETSSVERRIQPGTSVPFFAVIADPPPDLQRHRLHVKVESVDAWVPPTQRKGK